MKSVTVLGSTGSIGINTLNVIALHTERYRIYALTADISVDIMLEQCKQFEPDIAVMLDEQASELLAKKLKLAGINTQVLAGGDALVQVVANMEVDYVIAAIVGAAGLLPTLAAVKAGKYVLLANKEALVMSGSLFMAEVQKYGAKLLPLDSEHNAIWQCLPIGNTQQLNYDDKGVRRIILTASGGPFINYDESSLERVTPQQAVDHPNWLMGEKISVDSATMMNKGLEVIEAHYLFGLEVEQIEVIIHRQSIIHSMVDYIDGSVLAQMSNPDIRTPIASALAWPDRINAGVDALDLVAISKLDFAAVDHAHFPCLSLAYQALKYGGTSAAILNAANEVAVDSFLQLRIKFTDIVRVIEHVLSEMTVSDGNTLQEILLDDKKSRQTAVKFIKNIVF